MKTSKATVAIVVISILLVATVGSYSYNWYQQEQQAVQNAYLQGEITQLNHDQVTKLMDAAGVAARPQLTLFSPACSGSSTFCAATVAGYEVSFYIYHHEDVCADPTDGCVSRPVLLEQNFTPSCMLNCQSYYQVPQSIASYVPSNEVQIHSDGTFWIKGIIYYLDPTATLTQDGGQFLFNCKDLGVVAASTITCTAADTASVIGFSTSTTAIADTDTYASGSCASTVEITDSNGLADKAYTPTAGANGASITSSVSTGTLAISGTGYTAVDRGCLYTEINTGTNPIVVAEVAFGPDSLASGDSFTGTFSLTGSGF